MRRVIIAEGDGLPLRRVARTTAPAVAEIFLPPINPAQSTRDGPGLHMTVEHDGSWSVVLVAAYRPTTEPDHQVSRHTTIATGRLGGPDPAPTTLPPAGVRLDDNLTDDDAQALVRFLADRFGWAATLHRRADLDATLGERGPLTDEQWSQIRRSAAWQNFSAHIRALVLVNGLLAAVLSHAEATQGVARADAATRTAGHHG